MRDAKKDIVVRRSYRSGFQRNAIRKALRARFDTLKERQSRFGRGRFRAAIFDALSRNADTIRYPDGKSVLFGEEAITDSDLRDALSPSADLTKTWQTNDQKVRLYDAYLQLVDDAFPSAAAISQRYEKAKETLQAELNYSADSWQARGAECIAHDIPEVWAGPANLSDLGLEDHPEFASSFTVPVGPRFDGKRARLSVITPHTEFKTGYLPNAVYIFGEVLPGGFCPVSIFIYPTKGFFRDQGCVESFGLYDQLPRKPEYRSDYLVWLDKHVTAFFRKQEPIILAGMGVPSFHGLGKAFIAQDWRLRIDTPGPHKMQRLEKNIFEGGRLSADSPELDLVTFNQALGSIDQSVRVSLDIAFFGVNVPANGELRFELAPSRLPLVNNVFFDFAGEPLAMRIAPEREPIEQVGKEFNPPCLLPETLMLASELSLAPIVSENRLWVPNKWPFAD